VPPATTYVQVRAPGGEKDGDELAVLPGGRLARSGHGLPIGLTSQTTRKPATQTATAIRTGPCHPGGALTTRGPGAWATVRGRRRPSACRRCAASRGPGAWATVRGRRRPSARRRCAASRG